VHHGELLADWLLRHRSRRQHQKNRYNSHQYFHFLSPGASKLPASETFSMPTDLVLANEFRDEPVSRIDFPKRLQNA
jgi:hypothetical protein